MSVHPLVHVRAYVRNRKGNLEFVEFHYRRWPEADD